MNTSTIMAMIVTFPSTYHQQKQQTKLIISLLVKPSQFSQFRNLNGHVPKNASSVTSNTMTDPSAQQPAAQPPAPDQGNQQGNQGQQGNPAPVPQQNQPGASAPQLTQTNTQQQQQPPQQNPPAVPVPQLTQTSTQQQQPSPSVLRHSTATTTTTPTPTGLSALLGGKAPLATPCSEAEATANTTDIKAEDRANLDPKTLLTIENARLHPVQQAYRGTHVYS